MATPFEGEEEVADPDHKIMQAFAIGLVDSSQKPEPRKCLHQTDLPPKPQDWCEMRHHQFKDEFTEAAHAEIWGLATWGIYSVEDKLDDSWLCKRGKGGIIPLKWVFTYKFNKDSYLTKFKACICACGDMQAVTNRETKANTLTACIFQVIMAIVVAFDLKTDQLDTVNTFLNSPLKKEKWVWILPGMAI